MLFSIVWALPALADDFDPKPPVDPNALYKIVTRATPTGSASGSGSYEQGTSVTIRTSGVSGYKFSHWEKNGEVMESVGKNTSFTYTVTSDYLTEFVAVWEYDPAPPSDPVSTNAYRLYLETNAPTYCSFNRPSGSKVEFDTYVQVKATISGGYKFDGWYCGNEKVTDQLSFNFLMPAKNTTLTAKLIYDPTPPGDPGSSTNPDDITNGKLGDVNGDKVVDMVDVVALINIYLGKTTDYNLSVCDINKDKQVDMVDVVAAINIYLGK